jgi:hypothetical protein
MFTVLIIVLALTGALTWAFALYVLFNIYLGEK